MKNRFISKKESYINNTIEIPNWIYYIIKKIYNDFNISDEDIEYTFSYEYNILTIHKNGMRFDFNTNKVELPYKTDILELKIIMDFIPNDIN